MGEMQLILQLLYLPHEGGVHGQFLGNYLISDKLAQMRFTRRS